MASTSSSLVWLVGGCTLFTALPTFAQPCNQFVQMTSPNVGRDANVLLGVAAISSHDAWAVGHHRSGSTELPLSMHWNGTAWSTVAMPTPPSSGGTPHVSLYDAHAFAPDDLWAVGSNPPASTGSVALETLVYHWNGSNWSIAASPIGCCGSFGSQFFSIDGVSGNDLWAVGHKANTVNASPFAAHWNGSNWEEHMLPASTGNVNALKDLHVRASDDIWALEAVGISVPNSPRRIFHWNGSSWGVGAPPINAILYTAAEAIFAFGSSDIWVSSIRISGYQTVMLHYNGSTWTEMIVPEFGNEFYGTAPNNLFAVGQTSIMHWDGSAWTIVDSLDGLPEGNCFDAERAADGTLWCAGNTQPGPSSRTLTATHRPCPKNAPGDINGDGHVNVTDLLAVITGWGNCPAAPAPCPADVNHDGSVNVTDLLTVIANWS